MPEGGDVDVLVKDAWQQGGHVRLTRYLEQRLQALAQGHGALRRLARA